MGRAKKIELGAQKKRISSSEKKTNEPDDTCVDN